MKGKAIEMEYVKPEPEIEVTSDIYDVTDWTIGQKVSFMVSGEVKSMRKDDDGEICAYVTVKKVGDQKEKKKTGIPMEAYKSKKDIEKSSK